MNELELAVDKIKKSIERNNQNNSSKRRRFTRKNKKDILTFMQTFNLNFYQARDLLNISGNTLKRWHDQAKPKAFQQVKVSQPKMEVTKKKSISQSTETLTQLQIILLVLQAFLIIERIFSQLIF